MEISLPGYDLDGSGCHDAFRKNIVWLRSKRGLTQEAAANSANIAKVTWIKYERGERFPGTETLDAGAETLGVSVGRLFK